MRTDFDFHFRRHTGYLLIAGWCLLALGCMQPSATPEKPFVRPVSATQTYSYRRDIKPILEDKCIACHGCYDAPCQVNLTSAEGLLRGASKKVVYDSARLTDAAPTRYSSMPRP
jgi:hypothetical protein